MTFSTHLTDIIIKFILLILSISFTVIILVISIFRYDVKLRKDGQVTLRDIEKADNNMEGQKNTNGVECVHCLRRSIETSSTLMASMYDGPHDMYTY